MADNVTEILLRARMEVSGVEAGVSQIQKSLKGLTLPKGVTAELEKSFGKLTPLLKDYQKQLNKGFSNKKDLQNFNALKGKISETFSEIRSQVQSVNSQEVRLKVDTQEIDRLENKIVAKTADLQKALDNVFTKSINQSNIAEQLNKVIGNTARASTIKPMADAAKKLFNAQDYAAYNNQIDAMRNKILSLNTTKIDLAKALGVKNAEKDVDAVNTKITRFFDNLKVNEGKVKTIDRLKQELKDLGINLEHVKLDSLTNGANELQGIDGLIGRLAGSLRETGEAASEAGTGMVRMVDEVNQLKSSTQYFFSLRNMINLLKRGIDQAIDTVKELDAAMTETAVVTDFSVGDMWTKLPEYTANANALGASVKDMYEATTLYYQQGLNTDQAMGIAAETMKMARIGGLEAADATDKMTAALRGFNMELNETSAQRVNDVYSNLAAKTASDTEELGTAMQRTASIAASAGMSFEGTAAFLAQAIETTREPAENLGTAMKTIVARFTELKKNPLEMTEVDGEVVDYNKVDTALKSIGVALKDDNGQFRNLDQVFLDIAQRWDNLTQTQQRYVATTAAGSRQQSRFIAMMSNYDRTVQLMDYANNSAGASNEQFGKTMESLEAKLNKLKNAWDQFLMGITNSSFIKTAVDGLTGIIGIVNKLVDTLSLGSGGIKSFLSVFAAFTGLKMGGNIINRLIGGLGGLVDPTSTFGRGFRGGAGSSRQAANLAQAKATSDPIVNAIRAGVQALGGTLKSSNNNSNGNTNKSDWQAFNKARNNFSKQIKFKGKIGDALGTLDGLSPEHTTMALQANQGGTHALGRTIAEQFSNKKLGTQFSTVLLESLSKGKITSQQFSEALRLDNIAHSFGIAGTEGIKAYSNAVKTELDNNADSIAEKARASLGENYTDEDYKKALIEARREHIRQWKEGLEGDDLNNIKLLELTESEKMAQGLSKIGGAAMSAGQAFSTFGTILNSLGLETVGNGFMALGSTITNVGMTVANLGPMITDAAASIKKFGGGLKGIKGAISDAGLGTAAGVAGVAAAGAAAIGLWLAYWKKRENDIKKAGEKVREDFEEGYTKKDEQISSLESSKDRFKELSEGVDQYGNNIGLTTEEYSEYVSLSREIANLAPSLIAGYDAEGNAILRKGAALDEVIGKLKEEKQAALEAYTTNSSIDKLVGEYKLSDTYKDNRSTKARGKTAGHNAFSDQRKDLNTAITNATGWSNFSDIMEGMGLGSALNIEGLSNTQLVALSQHYDDVIGVIKEKNPELKEATEDQLRGAFSDINGAINEVLAEGEPLTSALEQWMGQEKLDAAGLNLGDEFTASFNEGLKGIELTGLTEGWDAAQFKSEIQTYANEWRNLAGPTSEYANILKDAKGVQDEYLDNMGSSSAISQYNADITESCDKLIELANNTDTATAAGQAFQQQCIAQANALRNYATEGGASLSEALNTAVDDITQAEAALDNFNEATKTDLSTAAEGMKSIYEKASETYTDSYGGEYAKHFEGKGDRTAWEAGRAILSEDVLESIPDGEALQKRIKEWEPALREGEEGWYEFKEKIVNDEDIQKNLKKLEDAGVELDKSGFLSHIPEDQWSNVAKAIGISEEMLTSMLNKGRQFADIDFTNWGEVRHNLETSNAGIKGTSTNEAGQRKLYVKESSFEAGLADANYKPEEYEAKKQEGREQQNLEYLKEASEYEAKELKTIFKDEMGFANLHDLISGLVSTGDFTKDEIQDYAEKAGYEGDFDSLYDSIAEAIENPELYKQTSVLEKISSQIALINAADTTSEKAASDRTDFAKELYGTLGKIDSEADYFAHGRNKDNSSNLSVEEYEATKKSLEAQQAWAEQQASMAEARATNASTEEESAKWQVVADQWRQDAENIGTYLTMGAEAYGKAQQENQLVQDATQNAVDLQEQGASNEEIKTAMVESAQKMVDAQMTPEEIAAAINQSYGSDLNKGDVTIDGDGKVKLTIADDSKLQEQLDNLKANIKGNISEITFNGAALASGQNNPNSAFHRHGTMARGSRKGYTISGRPTLTGEEGEELVWEPKRNQAYMVGSNGPQFANISKDAVVWNADQTKRIKKNSKTNNIGTGARGIHRFGTMAGGRIGAGGNSGGGGLKIPGVLNIDATAEIQDVTPPTEEPTIPVKADLQVEGNNGGFLSKIFGGKENGPSINVAANVTSINTGEQLQTIKVIGSVTKLENEISTNKIDATAVVTRVTKSAQVAGEPVSVKATATTTKVKNDTKTPKVSAETQIMNVTANTSAAQAKINKLISLFNKTYTLKYKASGPSSISVPISANFTGSWKKTVEITKGSGANGINNYIGHYSMPSFGSAARGKHGMVGPKNNGGLTLTGEKGFEIAWLPSENRSMILGSQGPQMLNLPSDAVVYSHEQSKKILKQQAIPAGSHSVDADVKYIPTRYDKTTTTTTTTTTVIPPSTKKKIEQATDKVKDVAEKAGKVLVWWENAAHRLDKVQRDGELLQRDLESLLKQSRATASQYKAIGADYKKSLEQQQTIANQEMRRAKKELTYTDKGYGTKRTKEARINLKTAQKKLKDAKKTKGTADDKKAQKAVKKAQKRLKSARKKDRPYALAIGARQEISYEVGKGKKKETKKAKINLFKYIKQDKETGAYQINQKQISKEAKKNKSRAEAIKQAAESQLNDLIGKQKNAEDAWLKAQDELNKLADDTYKTFYSWEKSINEIYALSKRLETLSSFKDFKSGLVELESVKLRTGFQTTEQGRNNITNALAKQEKILINQIQTADALVNARRVEYQKALNADTYYNRYKNASDSQEAKMDYDAALDALKLFKQFNGNQSQVIAAAVNKFNKNEYTENYYKKVQDVLDDIFQKQTDAIDASSQVTDFVQEIYSTIEEYNDFIIDFKNSMLEGMKEQAEDQINKLDKLNSSLSKALKDLLDEVKNKLEERRKKEDNLKTEQDISQKQQRLAMLRADTAGGHQVEIAQLEKEIADAQQNYQRSLEDQLLERLQNQADEAEKQRERQIELMQTANDLASSSGATMAQIEELLRNGDEEALKELYRRANHYYDEDTSEEEKKRIDDKFKEEYATFGAYIARLPELTTSATNPNLTDKTVNNANKATEQVFTAPVATTSQQEKIDKEAAKKAKSETKKTTTQATKKNTGPNQNQLIAQIRSNRQLRKVPQAARAIAGDFAILLHLANRKDTSWGEVLKAYIAVAGRKNAAEYIKQQFGKSPKASRKTGWKQAFGKDYPKYAAGGIADFTGPAWLDGTPSKPELVLNAADTKNFLALKDVLSKAISSTSAVENTYGGDIMYDINIHVDKIEKDYDVDRVVDKVKKEITKGAGYRNVTQVRNFR